MLARVTYSIDSLRDEGGEGEGIERTRGDGGAGEGGESESGEGEGGGVMVVWVKVARVMWWG
jgi:hypothetical protein